MRNITRYLIILLSTVLLSSCWSPDIEDAQELGFSSVEEMTRVTSQGYKTKKEYDERYKKYGFESVEMMKVFQSNGYETMFDYEMVKGRTPEWFVKNCEGESDYMTACFGKRIIWYGMVNSVGPNSVSIYVRGDKGDKIKTSNPFSLTIDSRSLKHHGVKEGQLIEFHGKIDQENFITPDIENITFVRFESKEDQESRNQRKMNKIAKDKKVQRDDIEKNKYNATWLMNKYEISAGTKCSIKIPKLAKYDYEWTDGFLEVKFPYYKKQVSSQGVLTVLGNKIKFQNGFGAWMRMEYWCDYDTVNRVVVDYGVN